VGELNAKLCALLKNQLETFPFHNLGQLLGKKVINGGTCFDHALSLHSHIARMGLKATLHEAEVCMTGLNTHRLIRVESSDKVSFLDSGTGWPTIYQAHTCDIYREYTSAGIRFRIVKESNKLLVKRHDGRQWRDMNRIPLVAQNEEIILSKYPNRYLQQLPYSQELRFCWLMNEKFYRITGFCLAVYETGKNTQKYSLTPIELLSFVQSSFPELISDLKIYLESIS